MYIYPRKTDQYSKRYSPIDKPIKMTLVTKSLRILFRTSTEYFTNMFFGIIFCLLRLIVLWSSATLEMEFHHITCPIRIMNFA